MARISPSDQNQSGKPQPEEEGPPKVGGPGLDPSTDPKIVVKAVNPPVTPDQVVGIAEMPAAATLDLPKIQNIKISPVKNKTIQGHLRAIEAKMTATEKLMKDIIKLQKLQIITEKEVFERKRELYQNTFEEYLLDKTVDFGDPDAQGAGSKKPKKPGGGFPFFGGGRRPRPPGRGPSPAPVPVPSPSPVDAGEETPEDPITQPDPPVVSPTPPGIPEREEEPGFQLPNVLDLLKVIPFLFQDLLRNQPLGAAKFEEDFLAGEPGTPSYSPSPTYSDTIASFYNPANQPSLFESIPGSNSFANLIGQDPKLMSDSLDLAMMFSPAAPAAAMPNIVTNPAVLAMASKSPNIARFLGVSPASTATTTGSAGIAKQRLLNDPMRGIIPQRPTFKGVSDAQRIQNARMIQAASSRGPAGGYTDPMSRGSVDNMLSQNLFQKGVDFSDYKPLTDVVDYSQYFGNMGVTDDAYRMLFKDADAAKALNYFDDIPANDLAVRSEFDSFSTPQGQAAMRDALRDSGSILDDITPSSAERAFGTSKANVAPELDGITNISNKASGGMGDLDLYSSEALNYFREMSNKIMPMADGGLVGWWNKGRNMRVPSESTASWKDLMADDAKQLTRTNKAFKSGATGIKGWNPIKAFTPDMVRTGPTPAVRQAFERPARTVTHPLMMALEFIINDLLINPRSTAVYDQVTGPNAYYNAPGYKGPMPSQNLENAQSSMMSGNNDQQPQVVPLPPDYIKIPGKKKAPDFVGDNSPDIVMRTSIFTRNQTDLD